MPDSDAEPVENSDEEIENLGNTSSEAVLALCRALQNDLLNIESLVLNNCKLRDAELILILTSIKDF